MILHVCNYNKFIPPFVKLINEHFSGKDHQFWINGVADNGYPKLDSAENIFITQQSLFGRVYSYFLLASMLHNSRKIFLHGLFNSNVVFILALCPWLLNRCYWIMWGGDLYSYLEPKNSLRSKINERLRAFVIKRFGHLVTLMSEEVDLARQWYGAQGEHHACQTYLSNVFDPGILKNHIPNKQDNSSLKILIGNSADPSNNHLEILEKLLPFKEQNILIFAPLSYGNKIHARRVIENGKLMFDKKFIPLLNFFEYQEYLLFLQDIDIAIFNHKRQQAIGNTTQLLGLGKKVYMRTDSSQWNFYKNLGISVFDLNDIDLSPMDDVKANSNKAVIIKHFSFVSLIQRLQALFEKDSAL